MPKTIIQVKTFICPNCRFHRSFDNLPADKMCPTCKLELVKSTDPQDKITMTVMGEEDIETEILKDDEEKTKQGKAKMTTAKKTAYRNKRKKDIADAIVKAKLLEDK